MPADVAGQVAELSPVGSLFAAFLGFNPLRTLLGPSGVLHSLPKANVSLPKANVDTLTGHSVFPQLISGSLHDGLVLVFLTSAGMMIVGAVSSWWAGGRFLVEDEPT